MRSVWVVCGVCEVVSVAGAYPNDLCAMATVPQADGQHGVTTPSI